MVIEKNQAKKTTVLAQCFVKEGRDKKKLENCYLKVRDWNDIRIKL